MRKHFSLILNITTYISAAFVVFYLLNTDLLYLPPILHSTHFLLSLLLLYIGFILQAYSWHKVLIESHNKILWRDSLASIGITIFSKYIPGKIWMILSRASYISAVYKLNISQTSTLSMLTQILTLMAGLLISSIGIKAANHDGQNNTIFSLPFLIYCITGTTIVIIGLALILNKIYKKNGLEKLHIGTYLRLTIWPILSWFSWGAGFMFLVSAFTGNLSIWAIAVFSMAAISGILAVFTPGGLGAREAAMTTLLVLQGQPIKIAITLSVVARLWFLCGEIGIFISGKLAASTARAKSKG